MRKIHVYQYYLWVYICCFPCIVCSFPLSVWNISRFLSFKDQLQCPFSVPSARMGLRYPVLVLWHFSLALPLLCTTSWVSWGQNPFLFIFNFYLFIFNMLILLYFSHYHLVPLCLPSPSNHQPISDFSFYHPKLCTVVRVYGWQQSS